MFFFFVFPFPWGFPRFESDPGKTRPLHQVIQPVAVVFAMLIFSFKKFKLVLLSTKPSSRLTFGAQVQIVFFFLLLLLFFLGERLGLILPLLLLGLGSGQTADLRRGEDNYKCHPLLMPDLPPSPLLLQEPPPLHDVGRGQGGHPFLHGHGRLAALTGSRRRQREKPAPTVLFFVHG